MLHGSVEHSLEDLEPDVGVEEARVTDRAAEVMKLKYPSGRAGEGRAGEGYSHYKIRCDSHPSHSSARVSSLLAAFLIPSRLTTLPPPPTPSPPCACVPTPRVRPSTKPSSRENPV